MKGTIGIILMIEMIWENVVWRKGTDTETED